MAPRPIRSKGACLCTSNRHQDRGHHSHTTRKQEDPASSSNNIHSIHSSRRIQEGEARCQCLDSRSTRARRS